MTAVHDGTDELYCDKDEEKFVVRVISEQHLIISVRLPAELLSRVSSLGARGALQCVRRKTFKRCLNRYEYG